MAQGDKRPAGLPWELLDGAPLAVAVREAAGGGLLYENRGAQSPAMRRVQALAGLEAPCGGPMERTVCDPESGRCYQLRIEPVDWQGRAAYAVYTAEAAGDSRHSQLEEELMAANEGMQDIINAIPGGVAIYKVSGIFETVYFSSGVPELSGYTTEEYRELIKQDALEMTYEADREAVRAQVLAVLESRGVGKMEFRKQHRDGHLVWVSTQIRWIGEEDGCPLLRCVFLDITALKEAQLEMEHLVNSIPGGIASYRIEGGRLAPLYFSAGVAALTGYTQAEHAALVQKDVFGLIYESDRDRVLAATRAALASGEVLDISYRVRHKDGSLLWLHLSGRRMGPTRFYAVFTGMSAETQMFQSIANETADSIYVVARDSYELLYANEAKKVFTKCEPCTGKKCYETLFGRRTPCPACELNAGPLDGKEHTVFVEDTGAYCSVRLHETEWNGIPAYVRYVRDVTEEVKNQQERKRLEQYFQSMVESLPGGIAVVRRMKDGSMVPEYFSEGFANMVGMTMEECWRLYRQDAMAGVHPDDVEDFERQMTAFLASGEPYCEMMYRLKKGAGSYLWTNNTFSTIESGDGEGRIYASYHDMTKEREERERIRQQFNEIILQHYRAPGSNALIVGHCNVTRNRILEIVDHTHSDLLQTFGTGREDFFTGIAGLVVDEGERQTFKDTYLNAPSLAAFERGDTELLQNCFIKMPREPRGRYVQFKVNLVEAPDTGDVTGILTVTDTTEQTLSELILHQLSVASYDLVVDVDLPQDRYTVLSHDAGGDTPAPQGRYSGQLEFMFHEQVLPKDREHARKMLQPDYMVERLEKEGAYSFPYSIQGERGGVLTKNLTVTPIDLRLGRVCLARADITESVREQQGMLNVIAYTFEILAFIKVDSGRMTYYTRQTVLENLPPYTAEDYSRVVERMVEAYDPQRRGEMAQQFALATMLERLAQKPEGYSFVAPYPTAEGLRYKQVNVLWGDGNHTNVCMVRADVTDMLAAERQTQSALEQALAAAEEANRAKSDFLSSMSHDIRTPMNAIMGMTSLAAHYLDDRGRVEDYLQKIAISSKHLLSLINDILDMSKIEQARVPLNRMGVCLPELVEQVSAIMLPQARSAGLGMAVRADGIEHPYIYGDPLRINQVLINILGNAIKFTPEGGRVDFAVEEIPPRKGPGYARYRFTIRDTGVGMTEEFMEHIFEPFVRNRNASVVEGTGLGLSITKGLVDLMEGEITAESRLHQGTTFRVELECEIAREQAEAGAPQRQAGAGEDAALSGRRFLIAEDNAINAEILCELLHIYGAQALVKGDGGQAVQAFEEALPGTYDAILMDIQMPRMNGYEATRCIRRLERPDAGTIPIVAMTANAFADDIQAALDAGMTAHVAKPIDIQVLTATLHRIFHRSGQQEL